MHTPPIRLAILETDTPLPNTKRKYGGYGGVFEVLLKSGIKALGRSESDLQVTKYQVELNPDRYPELGDIDAVLITGSRHDSFADTPWTNKLTEFIADILSSQTRVRVIGVCFGHQIVGRALGVKLGRNDKGWEAAVHDIQLTDVGKMVFGQESLSLHQMHRDIVYSYPQGIEALGSSPACKVQGMYARKRLITVQGHPEFTEDIIREVLETRHQTGVFDDEAYYTHIKKAGLNHDGVVVGKAFVQFLLDD